MNDNIFNKYLRTLDEKGNSYIIDSFYDPVNSRSSKLAPFDNEQQKGFIVYNPGKEREFLIRVKVKEGKYKGNI